METVIHQPSAPHQYTVIFLHGRDSTAAEFMPEFFESQASDDRTLPEIFPNVKWVFPTADTVASARFNNVEISQWFDMWSTEDPYEREEQQIDGLNKSVLRLLELIRNESSLVGGPQNVILGGISQGCATAIHALTKQELQIGGFVGLSSWLPAKDTITNGTPAAYKTPIFLAHSEDDDVIAVRYGKDLRDHLSQHGMSVEWHNYVDGGHWVNEPQGIDDIANFVRRALAI